MEQRDTSAARTSIPVAILPLILGMAAWSAAGALDPAAGEVSAAPQVIRVPNSPIRLCRWPETLPDGERTTISAISLDGETFARVTPISYEIGLRYAHFDPLHGVPPVHPALAADETAHLHIVQFVSQPLPIFYEQIEAMGGMVHHYVAQHACLVAMDMATRTDVAALPYVRWIGPYHPAYRMEESLLAGLSGAAERPVRQRYNVQVLTVGQKGQVAERIRALGGMVDRADAGKLLVSATLTADQLAQVIRWNEILFVDRWSPYETDMDTAREISGANYIETVAGYTGAGVRGEVFDIGFNLDHVDFQSRPLILHGMVGSATHGAATSGICFGDGTGQPQARGLLPDAQGIVADIHYSDMTGPNRYIHTGELVQDPYDAVFQSVSVGASRTTLYTTVSADTDAALFDFDIVLCQAQGNSGDASSRPEAWAKNIISAGGVYHFDTLDRGDDMIGDGTSTGPASDGRIKPTLIHFYDNIWTTYCCEPTSYVQDFGGTSASTPLICGCVGLFFQMWSDGIFGNTVEPGATVFDNRSHMTTAKAALINSAYQYAFDGPLHDMTRMNQGWGMPDLRNLYDLREKIYIVDEDVVLEPFGMSVHRLVVPAGEPALKVTMTYADPPGNPAVQSQHRINDLTLRVVSPSAEVYYGNNGLLNGVWSTMGGAPDTKNTVECVYVETPEPGVWSVEIHADEIIQDGHVETPAIDADYALVVSGVIPEDLSEIPDGRSADALTGAAVAGPNLVAQEAQINLRLAAAAAVRLAIYDLQGRRIIRLLEAQLPAGDHRRRWTLKDEHGHRVPPGLYFVRLEAGSYVATQRLLVVR